MSMDFYSQDPIKSTSYINAGEEGSHLRASRVRDKAKILSPCIPFSKDREILHQVRHHKTFSSENWNLIYCSTCNCKHLLSNHFNSHLERTNSFMLVF